MLRGGTIGSLPIVPKFGVPSNYLSALFKTAIWEASPDTSDWIVGNPDVIQMGAERISAEKSAMQIQA